MELVIASRNKGKIAEIKELLADLPLKVTSLLDYPQLPDVIEDGKTYQANALKKARQTALATGKMVMADDSGIEVKALNNGPGIYSARFAGHGASDRARNKKLLDLLKHVPDSCRQIRYRCVIAWVDAKAQELAMVQGVCGGYVTRRNRGTHGFGYDPIFFIKRYNKTFGELSPLLKAKISHRARALKKFRRLLRAFLTKNSLKGC